MTSLNQNDILDTNSTKANITMIPALANPCIANTPNKVKLSRLAQLNMGHGEGDTKWKG